MSLLNSLFSKKEKPVVVDDGTQAEILPSGPMAEDDRVRENQQRMVIACVGVVSTVALLYFTFGKDAVPAQDPAVADGIRKQTMSLTASPQANQDWLKSIDDRQSNLENAVSSLTERFAAVEGDPVIGSPGSSGDSAEIQRIAAEASAAIERAAARVDAAEQRARQVAPSRALGGPGNEVPGSPTYRGPVNNQAAGNLPSSYSPYGPAGGANRGAGSNSDPFRPVEGASGQGQRQAGIQTVKFGGQSVSRAAQGDGAPSAEQPTSTRPDRVDTRNTVPTNAFAPARVLLGVDASVGVTNQADPKPVLLRFTGPALSVGRGTYRATTDLTGCLLNGSATAELATERVFIRAAKMTCPTNVPNQVVTVDVQAFITSKGKGGVRGRVVSREGDAASRALIAGTLQGLGSAAAQLTQRGLVAGGTTGAVQEISAGEAVAGAAGSGLNSAAGQLSQYWIRRAEQYQPVVEMPVGADVEVVFLAPVTIR